MLKHPKGYLIAICLLLGLQLTSGLSFLAPTIRISRPIFVSLPQRLDVSMKISKGKSKNSKGNSIYSLNQERKRLAGKPGSKHFLDPNKIFVGNLSFDTTEEDLKDFLTEHLGHLHYIESVKIITDWKTGKSKGYGFVLFIDPIFATSSMEIVKGKKLKGRVIRLDQGKRKGDDEKRVLFVKRRERTRSDMDDESIVIDEALDLVDGTEDESTDKSEDEDEDEDVSNNQDEDFEVSDFDDISDDILFAGDLDSENDDDLIDGWYEEVYGSNKWEPLTQEESEGMNREQRRKAQKLKPRKKLPHKGFGPVD